ncbi:MAG: hypothetical protein AAGD43_03295 [Pseudomonadota bacterium]
MAVLLWIIITIILFASQAWSSALIVIAGGCVAVWVTEGQKEFKASEVAANEHKATTKKEGDLRNRLADQIAAIQSNHRLIAWLNSVKDDAAGEAWHAQQIQSVQRKIQGISQPQPPIDGLDAEAGRLLRSIHSNIRNFTLLPFFGEHASNSVSHAYDLTKELLSDGARLLEICGEAVPEPRKPSEV